MAGIIAQFAAKHPEFPIVDFLELSSFDELIAVNLEEDTYRFIFNVDQKYQVPSMEGRYSNVGAVVGATYPEQGERLRKLMPNTFILAPGYGAQGASADDLSSFFDEEGLGAIVNSSRGIIAAYTKDAYSSFGPEGFAAASRAAAGVFTGTRLQPFPVTLKCHA